MDIEFIETYIARQLLCIRTEREITQQQLADEVGLNVRQIQKYEHGINRVSASRLYQMSLLFNCNIEDFFPILKKR